MATGRAWDRSPFQAERVAAVPLGAGDFRIFLDLFTDPATMRFIGVPLDDAAARSGFEVVVKAQDAEDSHLRYWRLATPDMPRAGLLSLRIGTSGRSAEFGVMLGGAARGQGLARPACRALLAHAFDQGRLNTVHCRHRAAHAAMNRLATDLAFLQSEAPAGWMHWRLDADLWRRIAVEPPPP